MLHSDPEDQKMFFTAYRKNKQKAQNPSNQDQTTSETRANLNIEILTPPPSSSSPQKTAFL